MCGSGHLFSSSGGERGHVLGGTAAVLEIQVADLDVLNGVSRNAADDRHQMSGGVVAHHVAQNDAMQRANGNSLRAAHARAKAQENRRDADVAHGDAVKRHVFEQCAIHAFRSDAVTILEDAIVDGDVFESAVGFRPTLNASGARHANVRTVLSKCSIEERSDFVAAGHVAVGNGYIFG